MFDIYESTSAAKTIMDLILDGITFEKVDVKKEESVERHSNVCEFSFVPDTASKENFDLSTCHENKEKSKTEQEGNFAPVIESSLPFIKQILEEEAINIAGTEMKGRNGLKRWLKERIGFADISESTRLGNLHAKALDSSVEHLNHNEKN